MITMFLIKIDIDKFNFMKFCEEIKQAKIISCNIFYNPF